MIKNRVTGNKLTHLGLSFYNTSDNANMNVCAQICGTLMLKVSYCMFKQTGLDHRLVELLTAGLKVVKVVSA